MKIPDLFSSENSKKAILVVVIVALGISMAARKQFMFPSSALSYPWEYSVVEGQEKDLGHIHPLFSKNAFAPPSLMIPYSLHFNKSFHIISPMLHWIVVIALMTLIIRKAGLDPYCAMVLTMFVLFIGGVAAREIFGIPLIAPSPSIGYQSYDFRIFITPLTLLSILLIFRGQLIFSGVLIGLATIIHIKYGLRLFCLLLSCIILWNMWGSYLIKMSHLRISWRSVTGFGCGWIILFVSWYLYIQNKLQFLAEIDVPRVDIPFLSRLGWMLKNEPDDVMVSYLFRFNGAFFGFIFLAISTIALCELIRRRMPEVRAKIMAVILMLSVFIALLFFGWGFLFETLLIDHLPLSFSTMIILTRGWDLIWVVPIAFTIAAFMYTLMCVEGLCRKFQKDPFETRKVFLHVGFAGFLVFNLYVFVYGKDSSIYIKPILRESSYLSLPYTQICTKDTLLYKKTIDKLWELASSQSEGEFYENLNVLESIFDRTLNPKKIKETNNPDVKNLKFLYNLKSNRYSLAVAGFKSNVSTGMYYFWSCDNKKLGIHRGLVEIPFDDFYDVTQWISQNTPVDRGVIAPPYIARFSLYSNRVDLYDTKREGHMMIAIKDYYRIALHRLEVLVGPYAPIIEPGIRFGKLGMRGRAHFLSLQQEDFLSIRGSYPHYDYLVTENQDLLGFPKLYSNSSFAVYNISD